MILNKTDAAVLPFLEFQEIILRQPSRNRQPVKFIIDINLPSIVQKRIKSLLGV